MGMDLYSVEGDEYYRFNFSGWSRLIQFLESLGCDLTEFSGSNDGDIVSPGTCEDVADRIEELKNKFIKLISCKKEDLPIKMADSFVLPRDDEDNFDYYKDIIARRLKGEELTPAFLDFDEKTPWDRWSTLQYYFTFGDYCRRCAQQGGFKQC